MQVRELPHLAVEEGAPGALLLGGLAVMPHVEVRDQLTAPLEGVQQRPRAVAADERDRRVDLHHGQTAAGGRDRVTLAGVRLLLHAQRVDLGLPRLAVDDRWSTGLP